MTMDTSDPNRVEVLYWDDRAKKFLWSSFIPPTGASPWAIRVRDRCCAEAREYRARYWVQPATECREDPRRIVFEMRRHDWSVTSEPIMRYVKQFPSREAAEMWVIHHG